MIQVNRIYLIFNRLVTKKFLVDTSVFIIVKTIKVRLMGDIIIVLLVFWVVGKLLKGVFGGFSKSSFKDDK